jgi:hypothetical protein
VVVWRLRGDSWYQLADKPAQKIEKEAMQYIFHGLEGFMQNISQEGDEILE